MEEGIRGDGFNYPHGDRTRARTGEPGNLPAREQIEHSQTAPEYRPAEVVNVLLVEDNEADQLMVREFLAAANERYELHHHIFHLTWCARLERALQYLKEDRFDVILLDLTLPDSRGSETLLRTKARARGVPIIVLTGVEDLEVAVRAVREGAEDYLVKGQTEGFRLVRSLLYATERRRRERQMRDLERRIQEGERVRSLAVLARGVAHDITSVLAAIQGNVHCALAKLPEGAEAREFLLGIEKSTVRAHARVTQLLAYSGVGSLERTTLSLSALVADMRELLSSAFFRRARLIFELAPGLPLIEGDCSQLQQVVMNLVTNAVEALSDPEQSVRVLTGICDYRPHEGWQIIGPGVKTERCVYLEVQDTGCGIPPEVRERIFDPFFSSKFIGRGLGLAAVWGIVQAHHGAIALQSEPGKGTIFRVLFPAEAAVAQVGGTEEPAQAPDKLPALSALAGAGLVLMVEPDRARAGALYEALEGVGYSAVIASSGREAISLFDLHKDEISAAVLNLKVEGPAAEQVYAYLRRTHRELPVVIVGGVRESPRVQKLESAQTRAVDQGSTPARIIAELSAMIGEEAGLGTV